MYPPSLGAAASKTRPPFSRRGFLSALGGVAAAFALDPERALWVPGAKTISIPKARAMFEVGDVVSFGPFSGRYTVIEAADSLAELGRSRLVPWSIPSFAGRKYYALGPGIRHHQITIFTAWRLRADGIATRTELHPPRFYGSGSCRPAVQAEELRIPPSPFTLPSDE